MGLITFMTRPFRKEQEPETPLREAAGQTIDGEEHGWRRLTGDGMRNLQPLTQSRMQELAVYLWRTNMLANRLIELPVAYLLAEGVELTAPDEEAKGWLDAFWRDPINQMDIKLPKKVRELAIFGEQCWPVFVNEMNGHVRLGYLDPALIETVVTDPDNIEQPIGVVSTKDKHGRAKRYRVIVNGPEEVFSQRTREIRETFEDGECFYFAVNQLSSSTRGHSDMLALLDWLDAYDTAMFGELERWDLLRAFIWDVTMKGATEEEVNKRASQITVPNAGSVRVHNDAEEWKAEAPNLHSSDSDGLARLFRNHILGGSTLPEHWYGGGGDVNRATAGEMGEPTVKIFTMRQRFWGYILSEVGTFVIRQRLRAYYGAEPEASDDPSVYVPEARFPELTSKDTSKFATALQQVVLAAATAVDRALLSEETALNLIGLVASQLGLSIDPSAELERIRKGREEKNEEDNFVPGETGPDENSAEQ